jgi:pantoate--beta-alanine ligase
MITLHTVAELNDALDPLRGWERIAFVPTMGNLHEGHLALVRKARELADKVIVSIFVNPLQFGENEDFDGYPRTLAHDAELLAAAGVDWLFAPGDEVIYPRPQEEQTRVVVPEVSEILCGESRPGHFDGVTTVVCKLFNLVRPEIAVFGKKDYQQLMVIRRMVEDLAMPVQVVGVDTVREADGLAMSSRNGYLSQEERELAPVIYQILSETAEGLRRGALPGDMEVEAEEALNDAGLRADYVAIRTQADLGEAGDEDTELVILAAAYLGKARLIDNLEVSLGTD